MNQLMLIWMILMIIFFHIVKSNYYTWILHITVSCTMSCSNLQTLNASIIHWFSYIHLPLPGLPTRRQVDQCGGRACEGYFRWAQCRECIAWARFEAPSHHPGPSDEVWIQCHRYSASLPLLWSLLVCFCCCSFSSWSIGLLLLFLCFRVIA